MTEKFKRQVRTAADLLVKTLRAVQLFKLRQAEKRQGLVKAVAHGPQAGGQAVGRAVQHMDDAVPQCGHHLRGRLPPYPTRIFPQRHIPLVVQAVRMPNNCKAALCSLVLASTRTCATTAATR
jgi:hypothetical protein